MDETCSSRPLARNGKQVRVGKGSQIGVKRTLKKKDPPTSGLNVDEDILSKVGRAPTK